MTGYDPTQSYNERVNLVQQWQMFYKMVPRTDSKLTHMFANGEINMFPDQVARELICLYKYL